MQCIGYNYHYAFLLSYIEAEIVNRGGSFGGSDFGGSAFDDPGESIITIDPESLSSSQASCKIQLDKPVTTTPQIKIMNIEIFIISLQLHI
jgi:hypothetical protein